MSTSTNQTIVDQKLRFQYYPQLRYKTQLSHFTKFNMSSRNWCFTLNNPSHDDGLLDFGLMDSVRYAIYQLESGEEGTEHYQGYIELDRAQRLSYMKRLPGLERAHFEIRAGTRDQARDYCRKEDTRLDGPWEHGNWESGGQGSRSDIQGLKRALDSGMTEADIADNHFSLWVRYHRSIKEYKRLKSVKRDWKTHVTLLYGPPGTGKSMAVKEMSPNCFWKPRGNWWDGFTGSEDVCLDDFYGWLPYDFVLRLMDRYPLTVEVKGATIEALPKRLFITSNKLPHEWWNPENVPYNAHAFWRRVDRVIYLTENKAEIYVGDRIGDFRALF